MVRVTIRLACLSAFVCSFDVQAAYDLKSVLACPRPEPGTVTGSCAVRKYPELSETSPYPMLRWVTCLQSSFGLPSGGSADAVFFSDVVPEYEKEIEANLKTLDQLLAEKDRAVLHREQRQWEAARQSAADRRSRRPTQPGTMYMASSAVAALDFPQRRAIELACRIEMLQGK